MKMLAKKGKRVLAVLLAVCMVMGLIGTGAWAVEGEPVTVREYHVLYESLGEIRDYYAEANGINPADMEDFNCTLIRYNFPDGSLVLSAANDVEGVWSATPAGPDGHQPEDLISVKFNFYRVWLPKNVSITIPVEKLDVVSYDTERWLDFAEVSLKSEVSVPETETVTVLFDDNLPGRTETPEDYYAVAEVEMGSTLEEIAIPADPEFSNYDFLGWFAPGENTAFDFENTAITEDLTLTAKWEENTVEQFTAQFFLRLDKTVMHEDGTTGYANTFYTPHGLMKGAISDTKFVVDGDKTGEAIIKDGVVNGDDLNTLIETFAPVKAVIVEGPSEEALDETLSRYFDVTQEQIDNDEIGVLWYVSKNGKDNCPYHVDGVVYNVESGEPVAPKETTYTVKHVYRTNGEESGVFAVEGIKGFVGETVKAADAGKQPEFNGRTYKFTEAQPEELTLDGSVSQTMTFYYDRKGEVDPPAKEFEYMVGYNFVDLLDGVDTSRTYYLQSDGSLAEDDDILVTDQKTLTVSSLTPAQYPEAVAGGAWAWGSVKDHFDHSSLVYYNEFWEHQADPKSTEAVMEMGTAKGDPTVTFTYIRNRYTVAATIDNGGKITGAGIYEKGEDAAVSYTPAEGYHVTGVAVDGKAYTEDEIAQADGSIPFESISTAHSVTVTTAKDDVPPVETKFTVTYQYTGSVPVGATAPEGGSYAAGASVDQPANPTAPANYSFDGWVYPDGVKPENGRFTMPEKNIVITGNWTYTEPTPPVETKFTVTYQYTGSVPVGATAPEGGSYAAGASVDQPANPTAPANYSFDGWVYPDGVKPENGQFTMPEKNIVITGNWTYTAPSGGDSGGDSVRYYQVTVEYLEEGTGNVLAEAYTTGNIREGRRYDVSAEAAKAIKDYKIVDVDGETSGSRSSDLTITVWYVKDSGNGGDGGEIDIPDTETPTGDLPELPGEIDITDPETPTGDLPQLPDDSAADETEIVDGGVPMGDLPQTGTTSKAVEPQWTLGILALLASMAAAGLAVTVSRRKEEEAE